MKILFNLSAVSFRISPLTSLIEVVGVLIENYKLDQESTERKVLYRLCLCMLAEAYTEEESDDTAVTPKCLNPDYEER